MEKILKKERTQFKSLIKSLYPDKYVRVKKDGTVIIKNKFYSLNSTKISFKEAVTNLIPRCFASLFNDPRAAFENYYNTINYSNNKGYGAIRYLCDEYSNLNPKKETFLEILDLRYKKIKRFDTGILLSYLSKSYIRIKENNKPTKVLPLGKPSQILIPFTDLLDDSPKAEIVAVITTGNPDWDKELEKVIRFDTFF
jgi:hypothetical protein